MQYKQLGRYEIVERIGRGAMAEVFKARQPTLDRFVAIKILHPHLADDDEFKVRFGREAQNVARLRHNNIVQVYDFDKAEVGNDSLYFMVMELIEGPTLKDYISQAPRGLLPLEEALNIMRQAMLALAYAHGQGMIHRDLKPANLMLDRDGRVVMADFGIAKILTGNQFTASGGMIGTPAYMAPETGLGTTTDERSDLYSMGVILFQMLTGRLPFDADTPVATILKHVNEKVPPIRTINPNLPIAVEQIVNRAMAKDPDERYPTALDLLGAVEALQTTLGKPPAPIGPVVVTRPPNTAAKAGPETLVIPPEANGETLRISETPTKPAPRLPSTSSAEPPSLRTGIPKTISQQVKTPFVTPPPPIAEAPARRAGLGCVLIGALVMFASVIGGLIMAGLITGQVPIIGVVLRPSETATQPAFVPITATTPAMTQTAISAAPTTPAPSVPLSPTPSQTVTASPTATLTPTMTPSATVTPSQTATPSITPSHTPSQTFTATFTASPTETATLTPTPSQTATPTANFTETVDAATRAAANATATIAQATIVAFFETQRAQITPTPDYTATARVCKNEYEFIAPLAPNPSAPEDPIRANTRFEREVILRNIGDCDWLPGASLTYLENERFNAPRRITMVNTEPVPPGGEARFTFSGTTPARGGVYTGRWEFRLEGGVLVEPVVEVSFFVFQ